MSKSRKEAYSSGKSIPWNIGKKYTKKEKRKFISNGFKGKTHSEETKKKLREFQIGKSFEEKVGKKKAKKWRNEITRGLKNAFGNGLTDEHKEKIRIANTGNRMSDEAKRKMSLAKKGSIPWNKGIRTIHQLDLEGNLIKEWNSFQDIRDELGFPQSNLCKCCQGQRNKAGGFKWKYNKGMN